MRVLIHDYGGHPPQVQLSRELASRGHVVRHLYCASVTAPRGAVARRPSDPDTFDVETLSLGAEFARYSPAKRLTQERAYGRVLVAAAEVFEPEVVISANTPLLSQRAIARWCRRRDVPFTFWLQDLIGVGVRSVLRRRSRLLATTAGAMFSSLEGRLLRCSSAVVAIAEDFVPAIEAAGVSPGRVHVIENWAPVEDIPMLPKSNDWSRRHGLSDGLVFLYSGTLGLKHDPSVLLDLAEALPDAVVAVASEGPVVRQLNAEARRREMTNVVTLPFQSYEELPAMLASADVLVALLERDAGIFSVPSKVLSYQAAGRPILGSMPRENLAAAVIERSGAGIVTDAGDRAAFVAEARRLADEPALRIRLGEAARRYAESTFRIERIADRFEAVLSSTFADRPAELLPQSPVEVMT
jgi:colanic acid biosynthesis glycosyl transferase WcaI